MLIVCVGNICRSPAAEFLLRHEAAPGIGFGSAGLAAVVGEPADPRVARYLRNFGIDPSAHRARQITVEAVREADLVLTMERWQKSHIEEWLPGARGKVELLDPLADIPDPFGRSGQMVTAVLDRIALSARRWRERIACLA